MAAIVPATSKLNGFSSASLFAKLSVPDLLPTELEVNAARVEIHVSAGAAIYPTDTMDVPALISCAETAIRPPTEGSATTIAFFDAASGKQIRDRAELEQDMKRAIEAWQIKPVYQIWINIEVFYYPFTD